MAKRKKKRVRREERSTNWFLIGGVVLVGVAALFALLLLNLQTQNEIEPTPLPGQPLAEYCEENPDRCFSKGSADAPVTIVEISDYSCVHCKNFNLDTAGLLEDLYVTPGQVNWVVLPYALNETTLPTSAASMCAADQERFFEFHRRMFELQGQPQALTATGSLQVAEEIGLDLETFNACLESGEYFDDVQQNIIAASALGVSSTPTFFINDQPLAGNRPLPAFQQEINALLGSADAN